MMDQICWIMSYVVTEDDGTLGTVCIYQAVSVGTIRQHTQKVGMLADEITTIANTVVFREDPEQTVQAA